MQCRIWIALVLIAPQLASEQLGFPKNPKPKPCKPPEHPPKSPPLPLNPLSVPLHPTAA